MTQKAVLGEAKQQGRSLVTTGLSGDGAEGTRTLDPHNAIVVLSQLSYSPKKGGYEVGTPGFARPGGAEGI